MTYTTGQAVRWSPGFTAWFARPVAVRAGRITGTRKQYADCPQCFLAHQPCPGPWYTVDYPGHPGISGLYAEHQLQPA